MFIIVPLPKELAEKDGEFADIGQTENASKRGIYFQTRILSLFRRHEACM